MNDINIALKRIGKRQTPFIIAEMSGNHNQSLERALQIVEAAAGAGAHALKLQTYTADTMTLDLETQDFVIEDKKNLWHENSLYKLYQKAYTPWEWHKPIFDRCNELGIIGFSTPFDESAVDFLETFNVPCYKIASFENNHIPLLKKIAATRKPVIMSTGLASVADIYEAVKIIKKEHDAIVLLKCTSTYPADPEDSNLLTIPHMKQLFDCQVGLSDHTLGIGVAIASIALEATVIEKHFTLNRNDGGVDAAFSIEPDEMKMLVYESLQAWKALGKINYELSEREKLSLKFKRSLYITEDLKAGDVLSVNNVRIIRPGYGLAPRYIENVLGKKIACNVKKGTPVSWDVLS